MKVGDKVNASKRKWGDHIGATGVVDYAGDDGYITVLLDGYRYRYSAPFSADELTIIEEAPTC